MLNTLFAALSLAIAVQDAPAQTEAETPVLRLDAVASSQTPDPAENDIVLQSAGQYAGFHRTLGDIREREINSGASLDQSMDELAVYLARDRIARAWIAYASLIAEQHPQFLDDVREVADYYGRDAAIAALANDPAYANAFRFSDQASAAVLEVIDQDSEEIREVGEQFRLAAYDLQDVRWANAVARDRQNRLSTLSEFDNSPPPLAPDLFATEFVSATDSLGAASTTFASHEHRQLPASTPDLSLQPGVPYVPDRVRVGRILSIAALRALDANTSYSEETIRNLLNDPLAQRCISWARVNLQQCVAAAHFEYEDSFCIAQHALIDVSDCLEAAQDRQGN